MKHEEHKEVLALAALGALEGREQETLEAHLAACGECRAELRSLSDAAALLALADSPVAPPPELRSRLLAEIKTTRQEGGASATGTDGARDADAKPASNVVQFDAARRESRRGLMVSRPALLFGSLAASLAIAVLGLSLLTLWQRNTRMQGELASLSRQLAETRARLDSTNTELARARDEAQLLGAPDSRMTELAGTEVASGARARLTFNETTGEAVLVAAKLPPAPAGKAYQLWYIADGKPLPGSVFTTDVSGRGELRSSIPPEGRRAAVFAVTLEPAGGRPAPSGDIYLKGPAS